MKLNKILASAIIGGLTAASLAIADEHKTENHGTEVKAEAKKEVPATAVAKKAKKKTAETKNACDGKHGCKGEKKEEHKEEKAAH